MQDTYALLGYSELIEKTDKQLKRNFLLIFILGVIAGEGRFWQEGGYGEISSTAHGILEVIVYVARILIVFVIIGRGYMQAGARNFAGIFSMTRSDWREVWENVKYNFLNNFLALSVNFIIFMIIAFVINVVLFTLLEHTTFLEWLKSIGLVSPTASEWPVLLFFKNISIIPFTLVFETLFVMWIVERNKLMKQ
jgi:hypothetical protein